MMNYEPKRPQGFNFDGAPDCVLDCFDSPNEFDRYTVMLYEEFWAYSMGDTVQFLAMSANALGYSEFGECKVHAMPSAERINWTDLPESVRKHVIART